MRVLACATLMAVLTLACNCSWAQQDLRGEVKVDGSSTVFLITQAMTTHFKNQHPGVGITIGKSGTGAGFKKFAQGETDINDASRAIKPGELEACKKNGIEFVALQVALYGLVEVVKPKKHWARTLTV